MSRHWEKSQIPYFSVIQDTSEIHTQSFLSARRQSQVSLINSDSQSTAILNNPQNSYPEVRYVFKDDPAYFNLESTMEADEEAVVVELDEEGENIVKYQSMTPELQITDVRIKDKNSTKTIEISTTRAELKNIEQLRPDKKLEYIRKLVDLYNVRNSQLSTLTQTD